jgi:hypothetical protein
VGVTESEIIRLWFAVNLLGENKNTGNLLDASKEVGTGKKQK